MCQCGYVGKGGIQTLNGNKTETEILLLVKTKQISTNDYIYHYTCRYTVTITFMVCQTVHVHADGLHSNHTYPVKRVHTVLTNFIMVASC